MCGIAGILAEHLPDRAADVQPLIDAQRHRGPDGEGQWSDGICTLGHRRLAIIDLSDAGRQPMSNEDGGVWITFNGEIYNFEELRRNLTDRGHRFRTRTDTEAIIHAYEEWGTAALRRLRGMFAFGLWDQRRRRLLLARDRVGKKPLFYTEVDRRLLFASELQGLLADPSVPRRVNARAIDAYLSLGYVPAPETAFEGIFKLPPAHSMLVEVTPSGFVTRVEPYWRLEYEPKWRMDQTEATDAIRATLTDAVRLRLVSDVPLGAFLSGGIDSSIVVGLMARLSSAPVRTFSIGFEQSSYDELEHARRIARRWNTDHHELIVRPDASAILPTLVRHYGEPFADSSAVPTFYVSRITRADVTVALNGDGGDESFAGYDRYRANRLAARAERLPGFKRPARAVGRLLSGAGDPKHRLSRAKRFLAVAGLPMAERYSEWVGASAGTFGDARKQQICSPDFLTAVTSSRPAAWIASLFDEARDFDPVDAAMAVDVRSYLPYDLLVKVDITSMAHGLEARSPFLDHEVMELAARLPVNLKLRRRESKYLLRRAFADLLPSQNVRRSKMGFGVPVGEWLRGDLRPMLHDTVLSARALQRGYFEPVAVRRLVDDHLDQRADHGFQLWNLLMLELWHQELVDAMHRPATMGVVQGSVR
ncbi:MAG: asparagine synthase (glutamine-hydrolyzing) [Acidobacteria bacterium]|nr:asparagine synthase (glutamine-hydrolyzing) [Acidobacteriota bacterium]